MILDTPTRSLRLVLGEAHTTTACDIVACYGQQGPAGTFVTLLSQTASTGVTPVTLVAAPPVGSQNIIQEVRLHNADTVSHTVTLQLLDSATTRTIYSGTVAVGADWVYTPGAGIALTSAGVITFNTRAGNVTLTSADVTTALTFTPYNATNPSGYQTAANVTTTLAAYATLASPALTSVPTAPTAAVNTNTTQIATTAYVLGQVGTGTPLIDGVAAVGTSFLYSRQDHVHPVDTTRAPTASPTFTGTVTAATTNVAAFTATGITASPISGSTGSFTTLAASSTVSGAGITALHASPGPIGSTSASTGAFTTLSASSTITPSSTAGIVGTTTNDSANAGSVGEYVISTIASGAPVAVTSGVAANMTSISLTAGDWDVSANMIFAPAATTVVGSVHTGISTVSATLPAATPWARVMSIFPGSFVPATPIGQAPNVIRMSLSGTTTIYLVVYATFTTSTMNSYGHIAARRVR